MDCFVLQYCLSEGMRDDEATFCGGMLVILLPQMHVLQSYCGSAWLTEFHRDVKKQPQIIQNPQEFLAWIFSNTKSIQICHQP